MIFISVLSNTDKRNLAISLIFVLSLAVFSILSLNGQTSVKEFSHDSTSENNTDLKFSASLINNKIEPGSPAVIRLTLENTGSSNINYTSGAFPPFGVVTAKSVDSESGFILWNPSYREKSQIQIINSSYVVADSLSIGSTISANEKIIRDYQIQSQNKFVKEGRFRINESISYTRDLGKNKGLDYLIEFTVN